ncbi:hypothetical protein [Caulobacter sp. RHG1]|uniref:hypothetical protein n=1 Tax=Caulobacter sp. (strain RHG1) TaxID=2545762 RepID=UPI00155824D9|nr:hypothetical protein [Caulobacter sp. RHG1]NQE60651.1 hypothetical protein [Caulobacter sp. RHG1]
MSVVAILLISSVFVIAAIVGLADAFVHFVCWVAGKAIAREEAAEPAGAPAQGITA